MTLLQEMFSNLNVGSDEECEDSRGHVTGGWLMDG